MEIDLFTVIAQIFNFLLLIFLLKKFLYKPIIAAMDKREKSITEREETARQKAEEASEKIEAYELKIEKIDMDKSEVLAKVQDEADEKSRDILENARKNFEEKEKRWKKSFENEKEEFISKLRRKVSEMVAETARKMLEDMADTRLEKVMVEMFIRKLKKKAENAEDKLREAVRRQDGAIEITSAFKLDNEDRGNIEKSVKDFMNIEKDISFKIDPNLIAGIEMDLDDYRLSWNVFDYLEDFKEKLLDEATSDA